MISNSKAKSRIDMILANLLQSFGRRCSVARPWLRSPLARLLGKYCHRFVLKMSRYQKVICHINPELRLDGQSLFGKLSL